MMQEQNVNAIIQARIGSTRLPGKILMEIEGIPILEHIVRRLSKIKRVDKIIVATSDRSSDDAVMEFCLKKGILCVRGSEDNVLERFYQAAEKYPSDTFIRATGDNPMIDTGLIDEMLDFYFKNELSYTMYKGYPLGSGVEIFSFDALKEAFEKADKPFELEHVTPFIYQRMEGGKVEYYVCEEDKSGLRLTVDTEEDLIFARELFKRLYKANPFFGISDIESRIQKERDLTNINACVHQKKLGE